MAETAPPPGLDEFLNQGKAPAQSQDNAPPGLDEFIAPTVNEEKYGTAGQQIVAGVEGLGRGLISRPLMSGAEKYIGINPEDIRGREEANPTIAGVTQGIGLVGPAVATGGASLAGRLGFKAAAEALPILGGISEFTQAGALTKAGSALTGALGIGGEGAQIAGKMVAGGIQGAFENALYSAGESIGKTFENDPHMSAEHAIADLKANALFGAGIGAGGALLAKALGPTRLISEVDVPKVEGGDLESSLLASDFKPAEKAGFLDSFKERKPTAEAYEKASSDIGAPVLESGVLKNEDLHKGIDSLLNAPPTYESAGFKKKYNEGYEAANAAVDSATTAQGGKSKVELGNEVQSGVVKDLEQQLGPIQELYGALEPYHKAIPLNERSAPSIARNIMKLDEVRISPSSPESKLARDVADEIGGLKTVNDVKQYKSILGRRLQGAASPGEKRMLGILMDKLSDLEESSIVRFAEKNMKTSPARDKIMELLPKRAEANLAYRSFMDKLSTVSEQFGKGRIHGPQDALNFIKDLDPEQVVQRLFNKNDSQFLGFFEKNFPEQMKSMRDYQRSLIRENPKSPGELLPSKKIIEKINQLPKEVRAKLYTPEELSKLSSAEMYLREMPKNFNPSGTSHGAAFRQFFEHPTGAFVANLRDFAMGKFIKYAGQNPEIMQAARLAKAAENGAKAVETGSKAIFKPDAILPARLFDTDSRDHDTKEKKTLKKAVGRYAENPQSIMDSGIPNNPIPQYDVAFAATAANIVKYLGSVKPSTAKMGPLDPPRTPSRMEQAKYERALNIADKPLSVLAHIKEGTLTPDDVKAVNAMYPNLYRGLKQQVMSKMIDHETNGGKPIPYKTRLSLSMFLAQPLDATMTPSAIVAAQPKFPAQSQTQPQQQGPGKSGKIPLNALGKISSMYLTPAQSREGKKTQGS